MPFCGTSSVPGSSYQHLFNPDHPEEKLIEIADCENSIEGENDQFDRRTDCMESGFSLAADLA